jgi:hypothetical protein
MRKYAVTITGKTPLLMHWDHIEWADKLDAWKNDPSNKKMSKAGDDRTPAWRWVGYAYHDGEQITIPSENIMRSIMEGGAMVLVPGGRSGKTFKSQSQSGMMCLDQDWPLMVGGKTIAADKVHGLMAVDSFDEHNTAARALGFDLHVKRAKIGTSKHIRVRPMFRDWSCRGTLIVTDDQITEQVLKDILTYAGNYKGLCDWRPGSKTPGSFGMFSAEVSKED